MLKIFALCLGLTLLIELPIAYLWGLRRRELVTVLMANVMTNPLAVALNLCGIPQVPIELGVVLAEGLAYRLHFDKRPCLLSLVSNAVSWGIGLLLNHVL
ncbi:MAG: hypothetical protein IJA49_06990 [Oscillospiraceae bacterium]|nr:hypothetical protein [Oscillospiraceae bacterium]